MRSVSAGGESGPCDHLVNSFVLIEHHENLFEFCQGKIPKNHAG